jgi:hypothetical protein
MVQPRFGHVEVWMTRAALIICLSQTRDGALPPIFKRTTYSAASANRVTGWFVTITGINKSPQLPSPP